MLRIWYGAIHAAVVRNALELAKNEACAGCSPEEWAATEPPQGVAAVKERIATLHLRALKVISPLQSWQWFVARRY
jgi:hypothetical protein